MPRYSKERKAAVLKKLSPPATGVGLRHQPERPVLVYGMEGQTCYWGPRCFALAESFMTYAGSVL